MSDDLPAIPSPPPTPTVDLNHVPLGEIAEKYLGRVEEIADHARTDRPRHSQFGSSI